MKNKFLETFILTPITNHVNFENFAKIKLIFGLTNKKLIEKNDH